MPKFKRGVGFKFKNNPIISELNSIGYTANNVHKLLGCAKGYGYTILRNPEYLKLAQVSAICYALNKPLGWVLNRLLSTPDERSPNWLDEGFDPEIVISDLKRGK